MYGNNAVDPYESAFSHAEKSKLHEGRAEWSLAVDELTKVYYSLNVNVCNNLFILQQAIDIFKWLESAETNFGKKSLISNNLGTLNNKLIMYEYIRKGDSHLGIALQHDERTPRIISDTIPHYISAGNLQCIFDYNYIHVLISRNFFYS